jgi:hypothetical protein
MSNIFDPKELEVLNEIKRIIGIGYDEKYDTKAKVSIEEKMKYSKPQGKIKFIKQKISELQARGNNSEIIKELLNDLNSNQKDTKKLNIIDDKIRIYKKVQTLKKQSNIEPLQVKNQRELTQTDFEEIIKQYSHNVGGYINVVDYINRLDNKLGLLNDIIADISSTKNSDDQSRRLQIVSEIVSIYANKTDPNEQLPNESKKALQEVINSNYSTNLFSDQNNNYLADEKNTLLINKINMNLVKSTDEFFALDCVQKYINKNPKMDFNKLTPDNYVKEITKSLINNKLLNSDLSSDRIDNSMIKQIENNLKKLVESKEKNIDAKLSLVQKAVIICKTVVQSIFSKKEYIAKKEQQQTPAEKQAINDKNKSEAIKEAKGIFNQIKEENTKMAKLKNNTQEIATNIGNTVKKTQKSR